MRLEKDDWLSNALGIPSWKALGIEALAAAEEMRAQMLEVAGNRSAFFSTKIPTLNVASVANAGRVGFSVIDVNVAFDWVRELDEERDVAFDRNGDLKAEAAVAGDAAAIEEIAAKCFVFSRFHLDSALSVDRAHNVKRVWARHSCEGRAPEVYVARRGTAVAGFLAVLETRSGDKTSAIIDLIGVAEKYQGLGAGRALSRMFVERWKDRADRLRVGTQISNIPALRLYESLGFRIAETTYVLHAHVKNGVLVS